MNFERSKWLACVICAGMLAACGGGGDDGDDTGGGGGDEKTFSTPADGAAMAAIMSAVFDKVGGGTPPGGKAAVAPKVAEDCPDGGTRDTTVDQVSGNVTIVFDQCKSHDEANNQTTLDGQLVADCNDELCTDAALTFGLPSDPLSAQILNTGDGTDVDGSFFDFDVTTHANGDNTSTVTLDGRIVVSDNSADSCGDADMTLDTTEPLRIDDDTALITDGTLDLTAADGSTAHVVFNQDGSQTVTVNGSSDTFTPAELAALCQ